MTLREFLEYREHRFDKEHNCPCSEHYAGYREGWHDAARDIREVLEHWGVDMNMIVIPERSIR